MTWEYHLALAALSLACGGMAWYDWRDRSFWGPLYPITAALTVPWLASFGWLGALTLAYSGAMVAAGLVIARRGSWGAGDAMAMGTVGLNPGILVLSTFSTAVAVVAYRLASGPGPRSEFDAFWRRVEGRPSPAGLPYATILGLSGLAFIGAQVLLGALG